VNVKESALVLQPIGVVRNSVAVLDRPINWEDVISTVVVHDTMATALDGLEEFSHLWVLFAFQRERVSDGADARPRLREHPMGRADLPEVGVLATRSPRRPTPLGMTAVRLLAREGPTLRVQGLDAADGTPVLDLKPYLPLGDCIPAAVIAAWEPGPQPAPVDKAVCDQTKAPCVAVGGDRFGGSSFTCSRRYSEHLEDKRAAPPPRRDLTLAVHLWGVVALMGSPMGEGSGVGSSPVRCENVAATLPEQLRIPRSDWIDQLLPALGYRKTVLIELPLAGQPPVPQELHDAMRYLGEARMLRNHERYQKAVQECRRVKDALWGAGQEKKTWCQTRLAPPH